VNEEHFSGDRLASRVPAHIECIDCGTVLLAVEAVGPTPIDRDACPDCGNEEFEFVD